MSAPSWGRRRPPRREWDNRFCVDAKIPAYSSIVDEHCAFTKTPRFIRYNRDLNMPVVEPPPSFNSRALRERDVRDHLEDTSAYGLRNSPRFLSSGARREWKAKQKGRGAHTRQMKRSSSGGGGPPGYADSRTSGDGRRAAAGATAAGTAPAQPGQVITINVYENDKGSGKLSYARLERDDEGRLTNERAEAWFTVSFPHAKVSLASIRRKIVRVLADRDAAEAEAQGADAPAGPGVEEADISLYDALSGRLLTSPADLCDNMDVVMVEGEAKLQQCLTPLERALAVRVCRRCATLYTLSSDEPASCRKHPRAPVPYDEYVAERPQFEMAEKGSVAEPMVWPCCGGINSKAYVTNCYQFGIDGLDTTNVAGGGGDGGGGGVLHEAGPSGEDIISNDCSCQPCRHDGTVAWPVRFEVDGELVSFLELEHLVSCGELRWDDADPAGAGDGAQGDGGGGYDPERYERYDFAEEQGEGDLR